MHEKLLYRVPEAAHTLSLSPSMVWNLVRAGSLESVLVGRSRRIPHRALVAFITKLQGEQSEHGNYDESS